MHSTKKSFWSLNERLFLDALSEAQAKLKPASKQALLRQTYAKASVCKQGFGGQARLRIASKASTGSGVEDLQYLSTQNYLFLKSINALVQA